MVAENDEYSLEELVNSGATGEHEGMEDFKIVICPIGKYEVVVRLTADGHFLGVDEVRVNKSFIDYTRLSTSGDYHDIDEFYKE
jgi:hypothetical protein